MEDLLAALTAKAPDDASISVWSSGDRFASAVVGDKQTTTLWSAVEQNGKSCIRNRSVQDINTQLTSWSKQGFVDAGYAATLIKPEGRDELMKSLSEPSLENGKFNVNPLLLFGDPATATSCK